MSFEGIDDELMYELFVKQALNKGKCSDFAALIKTEEFAPGSLEETKVAVANAMGLYNEQIVTGSKKVDEPVVAAMDKYMFDVVNARSKKEVFALMRQYDEAVRAKYF